MSLSQILRSEACSKAIDKELETWRLATGMYNFVRMSVKPSILDAWISHCFGEALQKGELPRTSNIFCIPLACFANRNSVAARTNIFTELRQDFPWNFHLFRSLLQVLTTYIFESRQPQNIYCTRWLFAFARCGEPVRKLRKASIDGCGWADLQTGWTHQDGRKPRWDNTRC